MQSNDLTVRILIDIRDQITAVNTRLDTHDARFDAVDAHFDAVDARFERLEQRFNHFEQRFLHLESALFVEIGALHATLTDVADVMKGRRRLEQRVDSCERDIAGLKRKVGQES